MRLMYEYVFEPKVSNNKRASNINGLLISKIAGICSFRIGSSKAQRLNCGGSIIGAWLLSSVGCLMSTQTLILVPRYLRVHTVLPE